MDRSPVSGDLYARSKTDPPYAFDVVVGLGAFRDHVAETTRIGIAGAADYLAAEFPGAHELHADIATGTD
jgi:hypothetical protein